MCLKLYIIYCVESHECFYKSEETYISFNEKVPGFA